jgi:acetylornithine/N-succinyldiaminopimelate aminotransferase
MIGLQTHDDPSKLISIFLKNKLITVKANDNVIRILPSLIITKEEIDEGIEIIKKSCQKYKV